MAQKVAGDGAHSHDGVVVAAAAVVLVVAKPSVEAAAGIASVGVTCWLDCMALGMASPALDRMHRHAWVVALVAVPLAPSAVFVFLDRPPAHSIHSFHDHDRCWTRGFVLVEVAEILTWAERGMPLNEHCRTPLWPNSNQEKSAPDLIFLDVRRVRDMNDRGVMLRIAWKRWDQQGRRCSWECDSKFADVPLPLQRQERNATWWGGCLLDIRML